MHTCVDPWDPSHVHHSTSPSERPMYRLFPYPSAHLVSILPPSTDRLRLSSSVTNSVSSPSFFLDGEEDCGVPVAEDATAAARRPAERAKEEAEARIEEGPGAGEPLADARGGLDGPERSGRSMRVSSQSRWKRTAYLVLRSRASHLRGRDSIRREREERVPGQRRTSGELLHQVIPYDGIVQEASSWWTFLVEHFSW